MKPGHGRTLGRRTDCVGAWIVGLMVLGARAAESASQTAPAPAHGRLASAAPALHGECNLDGRTYLEWRRHASVPRALLERHSARHGWRSDGADLVAPEHGAACPPEVLDWIARVLPASPRALEHGALALERNGRVDEALAAVREEQRRIDAGGKRWPAVTIPSLGARLALHAGRYEDALEFVREWSGSSRCGNCDHSNASNRARVQAACLLRLDRPDEVAELVRRWTPYGGDVVVAWMWLHHEVERGRASNAREAAVRLSRAFGHDLEETFRAAERLGDRWVTPGVGDLAELESIARRWPESVIPVLLALDSAARRTLARSLDPKAEALSRSALAGLLAELGVPELEATLAAVPEQDADASVVLRLRKRWESARRTWGALSAPR